MTIEANIYEEFKQVLADMKPNLNRVAAISLSNLKKATQEEQAHALKWLRAIQRTVYKDLVEVINCMPQERWELHTRLGNYKLDEMRLRRERESTLRITWHETMPPYLRGKRCVK